MFDYLIDDYMVYCESKGLSKKTMRSYEQTIRLFARYLFEQKEIKEMKDVTEKLIREYIVYIQKRGKYTVTASSFSSKFTENRVDIGKKVSTTTINNYIRNLKAFFNFLEQQRAIKTNPVKNIKQLKNVRKEKAFISDGEFIRILRYMDISKFHEYRDYIIIQLLMDSGMRIGECLDILVEDVYIKERAIRLKAENTKGRKDRYVYFSSTMQKELRRWLAFKDRYMENEYLFCSNRGTKLDVRTFEKKLKNYGKRVGIDIHPHQLRNNFAKRFLMNGGNIYTLSKILGHSSVKVTEQAYLDLTDEDIRKSYQNYSPLMNLNRR